MIFYLQKISVKNKDKYVHIKSKNYAGHTIFTMYFKMYKINIQYMTFNDLSAS